MILNFGRAHPKGKKGPSPAVQMTLGDECARPLAAHLRPSQCLLRPTTAWRAPAQVTNSRVRHAIASAPNSKAGIVMSSRSTSVACGNQSATCNVPSRKLEWVAITSTGCATFVAAGSASKCAAAR